MRGGLQEKVFVGPSRRFLFDSPCSHGRSRERDCPLVVKLRTAQQLSSMLGVENSSSLFDSPPKAWMSESGLSEPEMTAHHTQWKN